MAPRKKTDDHEIPDLSDLEAENIIVRKKGKERRKPIKEFGDEPEERQPERKE
ncbi:MAG TPA: hypothetical protein VFG36_03760 [Methanoregula sp.]|nr:hypothetical protein [Methanoregula sp.]